MNPLMGVATRLRSFCVTGTAAVAGTPAAADGAAISGKMFAARWSSASKSIVASIAGSPGCAQSAGRKVSRCPSSPAIKPSLRASTPST